MFLKTNNCASIHFNNKDVGDPAKASITVIHNEITVNNKAIKIAGFSFYWKNPWK